MNVSGLTSGVSAVTAGDGHTCALLETGGVVCWGDNEHGQLGDGTIDSNAIPVNVSGLTSGVSAVTAGGGHTCALMGSGGIRCWGINDVGQVGNDESDSRFETPQDVAGLGSAARTVDAGANHTCALLESGGAVCWGDNADRQVGTGESVVYYNTPQAVRDLDAGVAAVTAGGYHSCALLESGRLTCWGKNGWGQLGDGTTNAAARPKDADDRALGPSRISAGGQHTCAVYGNGCALCWGLNDYGQLGDGREVTVVFPMDVTGGIESAIVTSSNHTCALSDAGGVQCWGGNYAGQLGTGTRAHSAAPGDVSGLDSGVTDVSAGSGDTCVVMAEGSTWCWGDNIFGQLGDGTMMSSITPVRVEDLPSAATAVSIGVYHACAILDSGGLMCWGNNTYGQLGIDDPSSSSVPSPRDVYGLSAGVAAVAAGESHTCALLNGGDVMCWGKNSSGQLGDGTTERRSTPVVVPEELGMTAIAADNDHTCAIMSGGGVKCWGLNDSGQLGDGTLQNSSSPRSVQGLESGVKAIGCGQGHTCAVRSSGDVVCWGSNQYGQVSGLFPGYPHLVVCL